MKIAHGTLVMAADGHKALLLRNEGDEKYAVLQTLAHEDAGEAAAPGSGSRRPRLGLHQAGTRRSNHDAAERHRQDEERFARRAAEMLEARARDSDADLVIVAPPRFLGALRDQLGETTRHRLRAEIDKDLVHRETDAIARAVARHLEERPAPWA